MWLNGSVTTLNVMLQLLVIYKFGHHNNGNHCALVQTN